MHRPSNREHRRPAGYSAASLAAATIVALVTATPSFAQPVIVEPGWTLLRTVDFENPMAAHLNPVDGFLYVGRRATSTDGLYQVDALGFASKVADGSNTAGVLCWPDSGHIYVSEDYGGTIYRTDLGSSGRLAWVSGFHSGDDDPIGMAIAPGDYSGSVLAPGEALVVDRGNSGLDEIWVWSPSIAEGEVILHPDVGTLVDAVDVAIDTSLVVVVDVNGASDGVIYEVQPGGGLTAWSTTQPIADPMGVTFDPQTGDLLVLDAGADRLLRVGRSGPHAVSDVITDLTGPSWAGVDLDPDGRRLVVTDWSASEIHLFGRCDATGYPELDCDGNGAIDLCDITLGILSDCNGNGVPDSCDIAGGTSDDCNLDGIPDDCPVCPPVEVVFVMDTSTSMDDEAATLCASMGAVVGRLEAAGLTVHPSLLGICDTPGGAYACLENHVSALLGTAVPGSPPPGLETLGACPGGNEVCQEDWGLATAVVAGSYGWMPDSASVRLVVPLSDEGPWCGNPVTQNDHDSITHAIAVARANDVIVSPITGTGSASSVQLLAQSLADSTGGQHFSSSVPSVDIAAAIVDLVLSACAAFHDCNENGVLDECDIAAGTSPDDNGNGIPDECEATSVMPTEMRPSGVSLAQNSPNPFGPATTIRFALPGRADVELAVYTVTGRRVTTLVSGSRPAGPHEVTWTGHDHEGRPVVSGTYFCRLTANGESLTRKMLIVR